MAENRDKRRKVKAAGFRRRFNGYYDGMNKKQIAADTFKTVGMWVIGTVLAYVYWLVMLLLISIFLVNVWKVTFVQILWYSAGLAAVCSLVYAGVLIHRKFYY
ncbi:MAG: hypothetical protein IKP75_02195 [Oscillospiraceae bacterium]|nr:hypothetical protein [Oscillospiraceae bacterium]